MYLLATTHTQVSWYSFSRSPTGVLTVELHDVLDLGINSMRFETKDAAKAAAREVGLKTWRYVRF